MSREPRILGRLILGLFVLSGLSGLIYEIVWVRLLTVYVGGGAFAVSVVLTVFMGGLALGSAWAARRVDRFRHPDSLALGYGLLEAGVAVCGIAFPWAMAALKPAYALLYRQLYRHWLWYNTAGGLLSAVLLLVPALLMGATLPLLCRYYVTASAGIGTRTGRLYGLNTLGAAAGAFLCGFVLIRWLGVPGTLAVAVGINLAIGLLCAAVFGHREAWRSLAEVWRRPPAAAAAPQEDPRAAERTQPPAVMPLLILAVSGFCSMGYEVIWTRLLSLLIGPTTYAFSMVLLTFITGLALGSLLFGRLCDRLRRPLLLLLASQIGAAVFALAASQFFGHAQLLFARLLYAWRDRFAAGEALKAATIFACIFPATVCLGAVFPVCVRLCAPSADGIGRVTGRLYMWNTLGALLGSWCAGFLLLPWLGQARGVGALVFIQMAAAALLLATAGERRAPLQRAAAIGLAAAGIGLSVFFPRWDAAWLARARYHRFGEIEDVLERLSPLETLWKGQEEAAEDAPPTDYLYLADGAGGFVAVGRTVETIGVTNLFLTISGKTDASTQGDQSTQLLLAHVPMLFHPRAESVMVLGLASGITAGEVLHYPVRRVDALEISPEVVRACAFFSPWNNGVLTDPRCEIIVQDARSHVVLTDRRYDVITSEPSNPWMAGVAGLFTEEFFAAIRSRLNPGGIFVQWLHSYQMDWESFAAIGRALERVFPGSLLLKTATVGSDYLFVCFRDGPARLDRAVAQRRLPFAQRSAQMRLPTPDALYPLVVTEDFPALFGDGPRHTERRPSVEFLAPRNVTGGGEDFSRRIMAARRVGPEVRDALERHAPREMSLLLAEFMASMNVPPFGLYAAERGAAEEAERYRVLLERYCRTTPVTDFSALRDPVERERCLAAREEAILAHAAGLTEPQDARRLGRCYFDLGALSLLRGRTAEAVERYRQGLRHQPRHFRARLQLAVGLEQLQAYAEADGICAALHADYPRSAAVLTRWGSIQMRLGQREAAQATFEKALALKPDNAGALAALGALYGERGELERCLELSRRAIQANPGAIRAYQNAAVALARLERQAEARAYVERGLQMAPQDPALRALKDLLDAQAAATLNTEH